MFSLGFVGLASPSYNCATLSQRLVLRSATCSRMSSSTTAAASSAAKPDPIVQYVVVRRDLISDPNLAWPTGSVIAQAVHASVAAVWSSRSDQLTKQYCDESDGHQMHTVVLEAKDEAALLKLTEKLDENSVEHVAWKEHPEEIVTAVAARPYQKSVVQPYFKKFKLFK